ncbi:probable leucine-rich repeat receptor-like protein kinase At1g68400 isoform X1 [Capsicum annuum]|uniref:probable leucine-rich repeat receptor-like protein kinase At1g68400 isoform X1 n=1 Tax=Capsicum annuum TaxID=4072 RepID=UPI0007BF3063|nr:probable leucine-rich repeat receptor-like protein kinase At1g68400 isoform X1 [Capsicum annuum]XP_047256867.1 probable leucine-rich repeat receptor-like protein kinase At1g68400 isoform X1 [Capsicum annuum]
MDQMLVPFDFHWLPPLLCLKTELLLNCPKLGKGTLGMAYKAILEDATTMVVKRLKDVGAGKEEFEQQMEIVGSIKHKNVVELRAYYYSARVVLLQCSMDIELSIGNVFWFMTMSQLVACMICCTLLMRGVNCLLGMPGLE